MKNIKPILAIGACVILSGCATPRKAKVAPEPVEPPLVKLVTLPEYGEEKGGYDVSAGCYVLGMYGVENPITTQLSKSLTAALVKRGYPVVELEKLNTAEARGKTDKIIKFGLYNCRSTYLPRDKKTATDIFVIVSVMDQPDTIFTADLVMRDFSVWGRDIATQLDLGGATTEQAIENAIDNLFTLDGFRRSLVPEEKEKIALSEK